MSVGKRRDRWQGGAAAYSAPVRQEGERQQRPTKTGSDAGKINPVPDTPAS